MPAALDPDLVWNLFAALIVGALVGVEREKSKALSGNVGIGGVRTFILFALSGAVAAMAGPDAAERVGPRGDARRRSPRSRSAAT